MRFSSFKVCYLARVLLLDNTYMKIVQMEPENQEKYRNRNNNEIERKLKDSDNTYTQTGTVNFSAHQLVASHC